MQVPCPVPLSGPWSPAGYQVVEVANEWTTPVAQPADANAAAAPEPAWQPSSPVGYRVTVVDEAPAVPLPRTARATRIRVKRRSRPHLFWAPVVGGAVSVATLMAVLIVAQLSRPAPEVREAPVIGARDLVPGMLAVGQPEVVVPEPLVALEPPVPAIVPPVPAIVPPLMGAKEECAACRPGAEPALPTDREKFGTQVAFARNPLEAGRLAGEERKLLFVMHVSGNFEESRFT